MSVAIEGRGSGSGELPPPNSGAGVGMSEHGARVLTDQIKTNVAVVWDLVCEAYRHRAWEALGYSSWDEYCNKEFGSSRIRIPREEREEIVTGMRAAGMSVRAISSATGAARNTVRKDVAQFDPPAEVVGLDGKTYSPPSRPSDDVVDTGVIEKRYQEERIETKENQLRAEYPWRYAIGEPDEIQRANGDANFQSFKAYADVYCLGLKGEPKKRMQSYLRTLLTEMENGDV